MFGLNGSLFFQFSGLVLEVFMGNVEWSYKMAKGGLLDALSLQESQGTRDWLMICLPLLFVFRGLDDTRLGR